MPPDPSVVWDETDDWIGVESAAERRKLQNRLHQRAYRKKRLAQRLAAQNGLSSQPNTDNDTIQDQQHTIAGPSALARQGNQPPSHQHLFLLLQRCGSINGSISTALQEALVAWSIGRPKLADLPVVTRLNAFDALARNSTILHISPDLLGSDDGNSPFLMQGPPQPNADAAGSPNFPSHLAPTALQKRVTHHPWLDLFPIPNMRDNILRGLEAGLLDEDELSDGLVCDLLNLEATSAASLVIWGDSWDIAGWEFSPAFFVKWAPLLRGCGEVLRATNYWRERRRAPRLEFVLD